MPFVCVCERKFWWEFIKRVHIYKIIIGAMQLARDNVRTRIEDKPLERENK